MIKRIAFTLFVFALTNIFATAFAAEPQTGRVAEFSNDKVNVWQTTIQPGKKQILTMHRHEHDRVLVAFDDGKLKVISNKGQTHYIELKKDHAIFLKKDVADELHTDENVTNHPIKVTVIEILE